MAIHACNKYHMGAVWDQEYRDLDYSNELFNDQGSVDQWLGMGYADKFTGDMCDMRKTQPVWNPYIMGWFAQRGWQDIGTSYYRMSPGTILPVHRDLYKRYIEIFNLQGQEHTIRRAIVFLEDWQSGHYLEMNGKPVVDWQAGDWVCWEGNFPHAAANVGKTPRYTLQITGI